MNKIKKAVSILLIIAIAFLLVGAVNAKRTYEKAQNKLADGKYEKAAELYDSIASYEDSSIMAMYCKALVMGENGDYENAINSLTLLGDLKDCKYFIVYYSAAQIAAKASENPLYLIDAVNEYESISLFRDSLKKAEECRQKLYNTAVSLMKGTNDELLEAANYFSALGEYKDSSTQIENCLEEANIRCYNVASEFLNNGEYEKAKIAFELTKGYKDSEVKIAECETAIKEKNYNIALNLYNSGKYEEAIDEFEVLDGYRDSAEQIKVCETAILDEKYNKALKLIDDGKNVEAYESLMALDGYKDSRARASEVFSPYMSEKLRGSDVDDMVFFGKYEQDNNTSNGKENIEWRVLAKEANRILIISEKALDCQRYNMEDTDVTWQDCSLHNWMNGTFINNAFSTEEQAMILSTKVSADKNPECSIDSGNAATDKVFLLSIAEAKQYFSWDPGRECVPTKYAIAQGAYTSNKHTMSDKTTCLWWLRSLGRNQNCAAYVSYHGWVIENGDSVSTDNVCVRPALWINLES